MENKNVGLTINPKTFLQSYFIPLAGLVGLYQQLNVKDILLR